MLLYDPVIEIAALGASIVSVAGVVRFVWRTREDMEESRLRYRTLPESVQTFSTDAHRVTDPFLGSPSSAPYAWKYSGSVPTVKDFTPSLHHI